MRYETPVVTGLHFGEGAPIPLEVPIATIRFGRREFDWHANLHEGVAASDFPTLTTMALDGDDQEAVDADIQRFLSALAFLHHVGLSADAPGATGFAARFGRAVFRAHGGTPGGITAIAPGEVFVEDDVRLHHALALYREAVTSVSPFYRFLALWNALEVAFDGDVSARDAFLRVAGSNRGGVLAGLKAPDDLAAYLRDSSRHAVAHAIRVAGRTVVDPDLPADRRRLQRDARLLDGLARARIYEHWPYPVWSR